MQTSGSDQTVKLLAGSLLMDISLVPDMPLCVANRGEVKHIVGVRRNVSGLLLGIRERNGCIAVLVLFMPETMGGICRLLLLSILKCDASHVVLLMKCALLLLCLSILCCIVIWVFLHAGAHGVGRCRGPHGCNTFTGALSPQLLGVPD